MANDSSLDRAARKFGFGCAVGCAIGAVYGMVEARKDKVQGRAKMPYIGRGMLLWASSIGVALLAHSLAHPRK